MTRGQTTCSFGGTASLRLLLPFFILTIFNAFSRNNCSFDGLFTLFRESGRHSKSSVKALAIFLFLGIKSTLITVPCNKFSVPRLLLQQLRCFLSRPLDAGLATSSLILDRFQSASTTGKINCLVMNARGVKKCHKDSIKNVTGNPCVTSIASRTWCTPKTLTLYDG